MKISIKSEWYVILVVLIPFIYLGIIWQGLPETVPMHWNIKGEIDGWGSKGMLWIIPILLPLLTYVIFLLVPIIDPKEQIGDMGSKYHKLKLAFVMILSAIAIFIIYSAKNESFVGPTALFIGMGVMFAIIGNYLQSIKPNYFIGIRTPWTLENELVWKRTHRLASRIWTPAGLLLVVSAACFSIEINSVVFIVVISVMVLWPVIYSFLEFRRIRNADRQ